MRTAIGVRLAVIGLLLILAASWPQAAGHAQGARQVVVPCGACPPG